MEPMADDHPAIVDDNRANHGIGAGAPAAALSQRERTGHVVRVGEHR
jgi:hypothetical protein